MCSVFWRKVPHLSWNLSSAFSKPFQSSLRADSGWCSVWVCLGNPRVKAHSRILHRNGRPWADTVLWGIKELCDTLHSDAKWDSEGKALHSRSVFLWGVIHMFSEMEGLKCHWFASKWLVGLLEEEIYLRASVDLCWQQVGHSEAAIAAMALFDENPCCWVHL